MSVQPETLQTFGATAAALGGATAAAGALDTVAVSAAVTAVFGLIGQEFAVAYGVAQANHLASVEQLAAAHTAIAASALGGLDSFATADGVGATGLVL
ncbi:type VII secretion target [Gordonia shandongensis]|uniref:type VII secretion target n=1 Tax=Gordonia shandongensis TaxID=376351 RepID=UPI001FDFB5DC|nr:hypothetical protein [Gordonia shandongensis]